MIPEPNNQASKHRVFVPNKHKFQVKVIQRVQLRSIRIRFDARCLSEAESGNIPDDNVESIKTIPYQPHSKSFTQAEFTNVKRESQDSAYQF